MAQLRQLQREIKSQCRDVGTEFVGGVLVGVSWLVNRYLRRNLYLFGSSALGSLIVIYGYMVMNGEIPSEVSILDPNIQLIGLAMFLNSVMIQRKGCLLYTSPSPRDRG